MTYVTCWNALCSILFNKYSRQIHLVLKTASIGLLTCNSGRDVYFRFLIEEDHKERNFDSQLDHACKYVGVFTVRLLTGVSTDLETGRSLKQGVTSDV